MQQYNYYNELYHYGVKGMKWGVRRAKKTGQNLGYFKKKRLSKAYKKEAEKMTEDLSKNQSTRYVKAYNKAVNHFNKKDMDDINKYVDDFNKMVDDNYNKLTLKEMLNNEHYKKSVEMCEKYSMTSFDDLAKQNMEAVEEMRRLYG